MKKAYVKSKSKSNSPSITIADELILVVEWNGESENFVLGSE